MSDNISSLNFVEINSNSDYVVNRLKKIVSQSTLFLVYQTFAGYINMNKKTHTANGLLQTSDQIEFSLNPNQYANLLNGFIDV